MNNTQRQPVIFDPTFFGQFFRPTLLLMVFFELLSLFVFSVRYYFDFSGIILTLFGLLVFFISLKNMENGLLIAFAELFLGSKGQLFFVALAPMKISLRLIIFCAIMAAFVCKLFNKKRRREFYALFNDHRELTYLAVFCLWGLIFSLYANRPGTQIFFDFNAWMYFFYFFPVALFWRSWRHVSNVLQVLTAAIVAISVKSLIYLFVFSHRIPLMRELYKWGRDTGYGEFTLLGGDYYRIFSQAHIYVLLAFVLLLSYLIFKGRLNYRQPRNQYLFLILLVASATLMMSLSRSFWVGLAVAALCGSFWAIIVYRFSWKQLLAIVFRLSFLLLLAYALIVTIIEFPYPARGDGLAGEGVFASRLTLSDSAVSSRWSQLPELLKGIAVHPLIGSGWGATVTYQSQDPRILTGSNPEGWYTTSAFEWGYLDLILKIGLAGLLAYLYVLWIIARKLYWFWQKNKDPYFRALAIGLLLALISLAVVHGFSPYLNHPLGIGFVILLIVFLDIFQEKINCREPSR